MVQAQEIFTFSRVNGEPEAGQAWGPLVVVGTADVACLSNRAVMCLDQDATEAHTEGFTFSGADELLTQSREPSELVFPVQVMHITEGPVRATLIAVNARMPDEVAAYVAAAVLDRLVPGARLVIAQGMTVKNSDTQEAFTVPLNGGHGTVGNIPSVPDGESIKADDRFLSALLNLVRVDGLPTSLLICPAHRPARGGGESEEESTGIAALCAALTQATALPFNARDHVRYRRCEAADSRNKGEGVSMLYL